MPLHPSLPPSPGLLPEEALPRGEVCALEERVLQNAFHAAEGLREGGREGRKGGQEQRCVHIPPPGGRNYFPGKWKGGRESRKEGGRKGGPADGRTWIMSVR